MVLGRVPEENGWDITASHEGAGFDSAATTTTQPHNTSSPSTPSTPGPTTMTTIIHSLSPTPTSTATTIPRPLPAPAARPWVNPRPRPLSMPPQSYSSPQTSSSDRDKQLMSDQKHRQHKDGSTSKQSRTANRVLGDYTLTKTLGAGSMGKVKLAIHNVMEEKLAIKILPRVHPSTSLPNGSNASPEAIAKQASKDASKEIRTIREAALSMLLHHPYICGMREVIIRQHHYYMVFEYVSGGQMLDIAEDARASYKMFEPNMDDYLDDEMEELKRAFELICKDWERSVSITTSSKHKMALDGRSNSQTQASQPQTRFLDSQNPAQMKRNVLASFTDMLLLPVTIVPRAVGAGVDVVD
ncbi:hypothetical protein JVU11DRAFT_10737 [Chiua virens]|nr:hypothetical protein JVU11DRAFT_10737 [Chiua virens]